MRTLNLKPQNGLTLIELMISIVIGLFILSAVLSLFVSMIKSDADNAKAIQLNHQLRTVMSLMSRDIRRAGSNQNSATDSLASTPNNPFSVAGTTRLAIAANAQGVADSCLIYTYDENEDDDANSDGNDEDDVGVGNDEKFGFRLDSVEHTVETRASGKACNEGSWNNLTDNDLINITGLTFTDNTVTEGGIIIREINIDLSGVLVNDSSVSRTISETVRVRNDVF